MEMRGASSVFPLAIRARLSTEDSASDYSSSLAGDSDYNSGIDVAEDEEEEEGSYETSEDDAASLGRPFIPKARITGYDEDDDILEEAVSDDEEEDGDKVEVEKLEVESSIGGDYAGFHGGFNSGREENELSIGNNKNDDNLGAEDPVIALLKELQQQITEKNYSEKAEAISVSYDPLRNEGGLELDDVKLKMDDTDVVEVVVEEDLDSIAADIEKTGAVSSGDLEQSNDFSLKFKDLVVEPSNNDTVKNNLACDIEELGGRFVSGREESGFSNGSYENDDNLCDKGPVNTSPEELRLQVKESGCFEKTELMPAFDDAFANGGGSVLNDLKREMDDSDVVEVEIEEFLNSIAAGYDQIGAVSSGDEEKSNDFFCALKDWVVESSNIDTVKNNISSDIEATPKSAMEVELIALEFEAQAGYLGIPEAEKNPEDIAKIRVTGTDTSNQHWNEEMQPKTEEAEFRVWEVTQEEASQVEADSTEFKGFEATDAFDFIHRKSLELVSLSDSKVFEPNSSEVCADNMETAKETYLYDNTCSVNSEKAKDSAGKLLSFTGYEEVHESYYHIKETSAENIVAYHAKFLDNFKEKHDESGTIFTQVSMDENYNASEHSFHELSSFSVYKKKSESIFDFFHVAHDEELEEEDEVLISERLARGATLEKLEIVKNILKMLEEGSSGSHSDFKRSLNHSQILGGQIISGSDEKVETNEDDSAKELFDTSALAALLRASSEVSDLTSQDTSSIFSIKHPVGFRSATSILRPTNSPLYSACIRVSSDPKFAGVSENIMNDGEKTLLLKVEQVRLKYLRLVQRLGHFADDDLPSHVLYRLSLVDGVKEGRKISEEFSLEDKYKDDFAFSCNILVLGKTGAGKSAAINSIFREERASIDHFHPATTSVREISGVVDGVYVSVIDTPGLLTSLYDQGMNRKILSSIKKYTARNPPDVVLYVDRLDAHTRDLDDFPFLKMITKILGASIWHKAIIAFTHAATAFPDGPDGSPLSYELVVAQRSHAVQQSIRQAAGDMRLTNPVALMENHPSCSRNMDGESLLPNGLKWRPWLLLLCYSSKILSEVNSILKFEFSSPQNLSSSHHNYPFPTDLSSLMQSKVHPKPSRIQGYYNCDSDIDLDCTTNEVSEEDDEYDQLPPIKTLKRSQVQKLNEQKNAYFDKYNYQLKLQLKKQLKDELRRLKKLESGGRDPDVTVTIAEGIEQEVNPSVVPIPLADLVSSSSFDSENPTYHCHYLEPKSQILIRPVICTIFCDFDSCYGVIIKESIDIGSQFPMSLAVQITKDKKEFNIYLGSSIASKHGENGSTLAIFDIHPVGKQLAYTLQGETKFNNLKKNKTVAGTIITFLGETSANGFKLEDLIFHRKNLPFVVSIDMVRVESGVTYGANLEVCLREKCSSKKRLSTFGSSLVTWADFTVGANLQTEFSAGRNSRMSVRFGLNNRNTGQISIITNTTKQAHITLLGLFTIVLSICRCICTSGTN